MVRDESFAEEWLKQYHSKHQIGLVIILGLVGLIALFFIYVWLFTITWNLALPILGIPKISFLNGVWFVLFIFVVRILFGFSYGYKNNKNT